MVRKLLIIGKNSFIGNSLNNHLKKNFKVKLISYETLKMMKNFELNKFSHILNCSINKNYVKKKYNQNVDIDYNIAKKIKKKNTIFILLSSRKVYFPRANIKETDKLKPISNYGINKIITERKIYKILKNKLLILRISNLIGLKTKLNKRRVHYTFLDIFIKLKKKGFVYDNKMKFKDFITMRQFSSILIKLIKKDIVGTYNVSIGKKILLKNIIRWLLKYNKKKLKKKKMQLKKNDIENESFYLNNNKLTKKININLTLNELRKECYKISKLLK